MKIDAYKLHACQSDYLVFAQDNAVNKAEITKKACARRTGAGADGAVFIDKTDGNKFYASFFAADGTKTDFCESACRALCEYAFQKKLFRGGTAEIFSGSQNCCLTRLSKQLWKSTLNAPSFNAEDIWPLKSKTPLINTLCEVYGQGLYVTAVKTDMPYAMVFVNDLSGIDICARGALFQNSRLFQSGINVVFIQIVDNGSFKLKVYRHGTGEVPSCGGAALAAHAGAAKLGLCSKSKATAVFTGGAMVSQLSETGAEIISDAHYICSIKLEV